MRTNITIWHHKVLADLTDFPVYVRLSDMPDEFWNTVTNGGGDIRCYKADGTTELAREVVFCDTTSKKGELHIKADLSSTIDTVIIIDADGLRSDYAATDTFGSKAVWSNGYLSVFHLQEAVNNTSNGYKDSVGTGNGTGTSMALPAVDGQLQGKAQQFDGVADYIAFNALLTLSNTATLSIWTNGINFKSYGGILASRSSGFQALSNSLQKIAAFSWDGGSDEYNAGAATFGQIESVWQYQAVIITPTVATRFLDNSSYLVSKAYAKHSPNAWRIGSDSLDLPGRAWQGYMDEARISSVSRSKEWILTEYNNQSNPLSFYTPPLDVFVKKSGGFQKVPTKVKIAGAFQESYIFKHR